MSEPDDPEELLARVGRRIAELRARAGVTQRYVAEALETDVSNYQRIEYGEQNLTLKTMAVVAKALGVDLVELLLPPDGREPAESPRGRPKKVRTSKSR